MPNAETYPGELLMVRSMARTEGCEHSDMPDLVNALHSLASGTTGSRHRRTTAVTTAPRMVLISSSPNVKLAICFPK
jgi:hypothetical protein